MRIFRTLSLLTLTAVAMTVPAAAGIDFDAGLRASIWNDNHKLGVGGELGAIAKLGKVDLGLHLNYSHFAGKDGWPDANETGGYVALYLLPPLDQAFQLRIGPHVGATYIDPVAPDAKIFLDLGGDVAAVFKVSPKMNFYAAFIPGYLLDFDGKDSESLFRVGFGVQLHAAAQ
jgi:hypothetical protein